MQLVGPRASYRGLCFVECTFCCCRVGNQGICLAVPSKNLERLDRWQIFLSDLPFELPVVHDGQCLEYFNHCFVTNGWISNKLTSIGNCYL
jgi:hypothetical protein